MLSAASAPVEVKVTNVEALAARRSTSKAMVAAWEEAFSQMVISWNKKRRDTSFLEHWLHFIGSWRRWRRSPKVACWEFLNILKSFFNFSSSSLYFFLLDSIFLKIKPSFPIFLERIYVELSMLQIETGWFERSWICFDTSVVHTFVTLFLGLGGGLDAKAMKMCWGWTTELHWQSGDSPKWFYCKRLTDGHTSYFPRTQGWTIRISGNKTKIAASGAMGGWE